MHWNLLFRSEIFKSILEGYEAKIRIELDQYLSVTRHIRYKLDYELQKWSRYREIDAEMYISR